MMRSTVLPLLYPLLVVIYEVMVYLSNDMYLPALPVMMKDLTLTQQQVQLTLTAWFLGSAIMPFLAGAFSDRFGRRAVLLWGGVIYVASNVLAATTSQIHILLLVRAIQGAMVATMLVPGYAVIHELYEQKDAIRILAIMGSIAVLAPAFGPLLGGVVLYFSSWRAIFWVIALGALLCILLLMKWMPETYPVTKRQPIELVALTKQYWRLLINKQFMVLMIVLSCIFAGFLAWITAGPLLVIVSYQKTAMIFGLIQAVIFIAYILGCHLVKYFLLWFPVRKIIWLGLIVAAVGGIIIFSLAYFYPHALLFFVLAMMIYAFGSAICFSPLNRLIIDASSEPMGVRMAFFIVCLQGSAVLGSGIASIVFDGSIMSLAAIVAFASIIACIAMRIV